MTSITEIAPDIYRISTYNQEFDKSVEVMEGLHEHNRSNLSFVEEKSLLKL
ncbi:MAG: hypothetical protein V7L04_01740 [Nostoc sp.]|uniref:hypothetical protein n=1 Tax=Nostoc sp. TaxID=1180 RepID=UPI002FF65D3B